MFCKKCGNQLNPEDRFCTGCGSPVNNPEVNNGFTGINNNSNTINNNSNTINNNSESINSNQAQMQNNMNFQSEMRERPMQQTTMTNQQMINNKPMNKVKPMKNKSSQNNTTMMFIGLGVIIVLLIAVASLAAMLFLGKDKGTVASNSNESGYAQTNTFKVNCSGFTFKIPDNLYYEEAQDALDIYDDEGTWAAEIRVIERSYGTIKSYVNQLPTMLRQSGYTSTSPKVQNLGGLEYITLEVSQGSTTSIIGIAKANSAYTFIIEARNINSEADYSILEKIAPILSTAEYGTSSSNYAKIPNHTDITSIIKSIGE